MTHQLLLQSSPQDVLQVGSLTPGERPPGGESAGLTEHRKQQANWNGTRGKTLRVYNFFQEIKTENRRHRLGPWPSRGRPSRNHGCPQRDGVVKRLAATLQ